jgi:hypothetical protein
MAAMNKCLAQSNKSYTGREATKKQFGQQSMGIDAKDAFDTAVEMARKRGAVK